MTGAPRVAVLMGGPSHEHDVSLSSGRQVLAALGERSFAVEIQKDGTWVLDGVRAPSLGTALDRLQEMADVAFIALHGPFGEDGTVQAVLETWSIPYTGSGPAASALSMDKVRAKKIYEAYALPTATSASIAPYDDVEAKLDQVVLPAVVKPACDGSSFGVSFPKDAEALRMDVSALIARGQEVLVEAFISGTELTCGVLERDGKLISLPVTEIVPGEGYAFFDYEAKYKPGATDEITPARISDVLRDEVQKLAIQAHRVLGCRDFSRTDFMLEGERPLLLETNTIPGLTENSLLPKAAQEAGISFAALVQILVDDALLRK